MSVERPAPFVPTGFTETAGGLLVPSSTHEKPTERWTWDEAKHIVRAVEVAQRRGVMLIAACGHDACVAAPQMIETSNDQGGIIWTCGHLTRIITERRQERRRWPR